MMLLLISSQQIKIPDKQDYYQYNWVFYDESYVIEDLFNFIFLRFSYLAERKLAV